MKLFYWQVVLGLFSSFVGGAAPTVHYVDMNSTNAISPFTDWATAATNIQDSVDAATAGDEVVVTNGIYASGGWMFSRVSITKQIAVRSVHGPEFTFIVGQQAPQTTNGFGAIRCVYLTNGAVLAGFTLTNGAAQALTNDLYDSGGGVYCRDNSAVVSNCVIVGNYALRNRGGGAYQGTLSNCRLVGNGAATGGGAYNSILIDCLVTSNFAKGGGGVFSDTGANLLTRCIITHNTCSGTFGGAIGVLNDCLVTYNTAYAFCGGASGKLTNCTLVGNEVTGDKGQGGGTYEGTLQNCIVYGNVAANGPNYIYSRLYNCCTVPFATNGVGNFTNAPMFVGESGGNLRLQSSSPCINTGNNSHITSVTDLDGRPRIANGQIDVGAYEFQPDVSGLFISWLQKYGLPTDGTADSTDADEDGMNSLQEWLAGTNPTNALSVLMMLAPSNSVSGVAVPWQSVSGIRYYMKRSTNLAAQPAFTSVRSNLIGQAAVTTFTDTNASGQGPFFYRVGVQQ